MRGNSCHSLFNSDSCTELDQYCAPPVPGFISKTLLRTRGASFSEPISIPSLGHTLGGDLAEVEDRHLCPVRCLKVYLSRTKPLGKGKASLHLSSEK